MIWVFVILIVLAMGGIGLVAAGRGAPMVEEYDDRPDLFLPESGALTGSDLRRVRFPIGWRGYRMAEVDALLSRLAAQLEAEQASATRSPEAEQASATGTSEVEQASATRTSEVEQASASERRRNPDPDDDRDWRPSPVTDPPRSDSPDQDAPHKPDSEPTE
ncbi:DivIVA domain-containing protein [Nocardioides sp. GXZ039]|uniref:DivIVA domain-containing protein n=1 Tax=Nocardioides sp. GXZ039 TaxID=3136018 RepID=UPI0030F40B59